MVNIFDEPGYVPMTRPCVQSTFNIQRYLIIINEEMKSWTALTWNMGMKTAI